MCNFAGLLWSVSWLCSQWRAMWVPSQWIMDITTGNMRTMLCSRIWQFPTLLLLFPCGSPTTLFFCWLNFLVSKNPETIEPIFKQTTNFPMKHKIWRVADFIVFIETFKCHLSTSTGSMNSFCETLVTLMYLNSASAVFGLVSAMTLVGFCVMHYIAICLPLRYSWYFSANLYFFATLARFLHLCCPSETNIGWQGGFFTIPFTKESRHRNGRIQGAILPASEKIFLPKDEFQSGTLQRTLLGLCYCVWIQYVWDHYEEHDGAANDQSAKNTLGLYLRS